MFGVVFSLHPSIVPLHRTWYIFIAVRRTYREQNLRSDALSIIVNRYFRRQCNRLSLAPVTNVPPPPARRTRTHRAYSTLLILLWRENLFVMEPVWQIGNVWFCSNKHLLKPIFLELASHQLSFDAFIYLNFRSYFSHSCFMACWLQVNKPHKWLSAMMCLKCISIDSLCPKLFSNVYIIIF